MSKRIVVVAITGASGAAYAQRLIQSLVDAECQVDLICSPYGKVLLRDELGIEKVDAASILKNQSERLTTHNHGDQTSVLASGSYLTDGMIVCPASSNTVAAIAAGMADNLIHRAAAVTLKEQRRLIVVPREMPWSHIELTNAVKISEAGGIICPASPGFYMKPTSIDDLVNFVVGKLLDLIGVHHELNTRWNPSQA